MHGRGPEFMKTHRIRGRYHGGDQRTNYSGDFTHQLSTDIAKILTWEYGGREGEIDPLISARKICTELFSKI